MKSLSPAAQAFWGSAIRHLLGILAGVLVSHGYVSQSDANNYTEEIVGVLLGAIVMVWGNRTVYWSQIKQLVARSLPHPATDHAVTEKVDELQAAKALPSVFTPPNVTPTLTKP